MDLNDKKIVVVGGAGLIGSHVVEELVKSPVREIVIYDNFARGTPENLRDALLDKRVTVFSHGGDVLQTDLLDQAVAGSDAVVHLAALWLLHCHEYPQSAFE